MTLCAVSLSIFITAIARALLTIEIVAVVAKLSRRLRYVGVAGLQKHASV